MDYTAELKSNLEKAIDYMRAEIVSLRTGRATPSLVEDIKVDYYGTPTPLKQIAAINVPEARMIVIQPWDKSVIEKTEKAISESDLNLNPSNDGQVIRIAVPPLNEERRTELVRVLKTKAEEARVSVRNMRREIFEQVKADKEKGAISEDSMYDEEKKIQKLTDEYNGKIDEISDAKEKEIMEV